MRLRTSLPHPRLASFYFFYFASVGAFLPYWGLYLEHLSFTLSEIGELMAVTMATKIIAPYVWGWIADHTGKRVWIIRVAAMLCAAIFSAALVATGYWWMLTILAAFSFFWNAVLPQFEVTTLDHLGDSVHHYSRVRVWGSVGFILAAVVLGPLLARLGIQWLPAILLALLTAIWVNTLSLAEHDDPRHPDHAGMLATLRRPVVISLLVACFLLQASHGPYYAFFSIYLEDHGYTAGAVGWLWALGVIAEIGVFVRMSAWLPRHGARTLLLAATAMAVVRWLLTAALAGYLPAMLIAQVMHAGSFGLYHGASIYLIYQLFPGRLQGRGQALYSSMSFGLGGAVGSLLSGYVWTAAGASWAFVGAAIAAAAGVLVVWRGVRPQTRSYAA